MNTSLNRRVFWLGFPLGMAAAASFAFVQPQSPRLPDLDARENAIAPGGAVSDAQRSAAGALCAGRPGVQVDFHSVLGSPRWIWSQDGFLTSKAPASSLAVDAHQPLKSFLDQNRTLFGFGSDILQQARVSREFVGANNLLHTTVWQQQVGGTPLFEAVLIAHLTAAGELVNVSSQFIPDPVGAAVNGVGDWQALLASPPVSPSRAVALAARSIGENTPDESVQAMAQPADAPAAVNGAVRRQFQAADILGDAEVASIWLPLDKTRLRLCWDVLLTGRTRGEMFRVLVDAVGGQVLVRRCLTEYISDVSYRVYTNDSPTPMSPGFPTPVTNQPPTVPRVLVTLPALDTNASPAGWIDDGNNETVGNNVDAHLDRNNDNLPDLPRPSGSPLRVFDATLNIAKDPTNYSAAAVIQLFYTCNWMHDKLYQLGFNEAAGNFQSNNFGRGGLGGDLVRADAQDGGGFNNANFSTPPDGLPPRMQMYLWDGPTPRRDGDLDAEIVLHEYTHGLSNRRVGGGVGITALQTRGMGEGWSDFYAMSLLSQPGDDVNGTYGEGAYSTYKLTLVFLQNYYFGIRRYPYTTDLAKNPLTYNDIDTVHADHCYSGAPYSGAAAGSCETASPAEVHNQGEVWCAMLWEVRANLIAKYGDVAGNQLSLQIVTDGMNLSPPDPTFLQARDAILQADLVDNAGSNRFEIWSGFAKRGLGCSASGPSNSTTVGTHEAFDVPDDLQVGPAIGLVSSGPVGGPFTPACQTYSLWNTGATALSWTASVGAPWITVAPGSGTLAPGETNQVSVCLAPAAGAMPIGLYTASLVLSNTGSRVTQSRPLSFAANPPRILFFPLDIDPGWTRQGQWAFGQPAGLGGAAHGHPDPAAGATGTNVFGYNLAGDYSTTAGFPNYLVAGPFNFAGYSNLRLQFQRWLNTDTRPAVFAGIDISTNGSTWSPVWTNGFAEIADATWTRVTCDLSAQADNQPTVYVRWVHRLNVLGAYAYSGWNIDDVEFLGTNLLDHFAVAHVPSPQSANVPFLVSIEARDAANGLLTGFSGIVSLSLSNGLVPLSPAVSGPFVQGIWTGLVAVAQAAPGLSLVASDASAHAGLSDPFNVVTAPRLDLSLSSSNLSLAWPAGAPGLMLESSISLSPPAWTPVTNAPTQVGDQLILPIGVADPQRFYRLHYTAP